MLEKDSGAAESVADVLGGSSAFGRIPLPAGADKQPSAPSLNSRASPLRLRFRRRRSRRHTRWAVRRPSPGGSAGQLIPIRTGAAPAAAAAAPAPAFVPASHAVAAPASAPRNAAPTAGPTTAAAAAFTRTLGAGGDHRRAGPSHGLPRPTDHCVARGGPSAAHLALAVRCRCRKPSSGSRSGLRLDFRASTSRPAWNYIPGSADRRPDRLVRQGAATVIHDPGQWVPPRGSGPGTRPCHPLRSPNSGGNCCRPPVGGTGYRGLAHTAARAVWREQACWTRR